LIYRWRKDLRLATPGFTELVVSPDSGETRAPTEAQDSSIEVMIGEQVRARIPLSAPPDLAAAVVKALALGTRTER
jgi:transposase